MPLEMPFKFIFLPSTLFKQRVIFNDQRILKFKYLGIEFLLLLFKEQHNKKTLFFFFSGFNKSEVEKTLSEFLQMLK